MRKGDLQLAGRLQQILDESDPFLIEVLENKKDDELHSYAEKMEKSFKYDKFSRNDNLRNLANNTLKTIYAYIELQRINANIKKLRDGEDEDDYGGVSLS